MEEGVFVEYPISRDNGAFINTEHEMIAGKAVTSLSPQTWDFCDMESCVKGNRTVQWGNCDMLGLELMLCPQRELITVSLICLSFRRALMTGGMSVSGCALPGCYLLHSNVCYVAVFSA